MRISPLLEIKLKNGKKKACRKRKLINDAVKNRATVVRQMSFKLGLDRVQEVLVLALMLVLVFAVFYSNIELTYKIGIAVLVFSIIFLTGMASQAAKQEAEQRRF
jgi:predicted cation transporter